MTPIVSGTASGSLAAPDFQVLSQSCSDVPSSHQLRAAKNHMWPTRAQRRVPRTSIFQFTQSSPEVAPEVNGHAARPALRRACAQSRVSVVADFSEMPERVHPPGRIHRQIALKEGTPYLPRARINEAQA